MRSQAKPRRPGTRRTAARVLPLVAAAWFLPALAAAQAPADPRVGLKGGWMDAGEAISNLELVAHRDRPEGWFNPQNAGDFGFADADLAFKGNLVFQGGYHGFQAWDLSDPRNPRVRATFTCPGGQGDVSVWGNLLFMSVEETRGRVDCGTQGVQDTVSADRFRGVRIFDIADLDHPRQVAAVQTCRGSHTHTLVPDPKDPNTLYVYVQGTSPSRPAAELAGCTGRHPDATDPNSSYFRIEIIKVPLQAPQQAAIVNAPRIFADSAGNIAGLWHGGDYGPGTQRTPVTNQCHDITVYPQIGLAAGACAGNGILLDISDPATPRRIDQVSDPNFAYWHSATFSNDGSRVVFTDEWGGGTQPRCQATDRKEWGADAIFTLADRKLHQVGYYKLPAAQSAVENCVAHNGSLIPVPGRNLMVQAWYQGGVSVFDFTDAAHPKEIAFFDRGPIDPAKLTLGGYWSAYWYNGQIYGSEIGRGLDVFRLKPSEFLTQNEIDAANLVKVAQFNPQDQQKIVWPAAFVVARAYVDQINRDHDLSPTVTAGISRDLARAEHSAGAARRATLRTLATRVDASAARSADPAKVRALAATVRQLAAR